MPGTVANKEEEAKKLQAMIEANPELQQVVDDFDREYEFRKKLVAARKETGLTQKELENLSGLDQRAISRLEKDQNVSPNLKTVLRYIDAMGCELHIAAKVSTN